MYDKWDKPIEIIFAFATLGVVLGVWKLIEIIFWIIKHVKISW